MTTRLVPDYVEVARRWWSAVPEILTPVTPGFLNGGNDGVVRSAEGTIIVDCGGHEAKADVIAASLNYMALVKDKSEFIIQVDKSHYKMGIQDERNRVLSMLNRLVDDTHGESGRYYGDALLETIKKVESGERYAQED